MLIEINLAPGATTTRNRARMPQVFSLPSLPSLRESASVIGGVLVGTLLIGFTGFGYWLLGERRSGLEARIQEEVADSTDLAAAIALLTELDAKQDSIEQRISLIRGVDSRRYIWPHLLDEISLALPEFTWITAINSAETRFPSVEPEDSAAKSGPRFVIQGNAGSTQALTRFMKNLEASPFIQNVTLVTAEQEQVEGRAIQRFSLEASYRSPDPSFIQTHTLLSFD